MADTSQGQQNNQVATGQGAQPAVQRTQVSQPPTNSTDSQVGQASSVGKSQTTVPAPSSSNNQSQDASVGTQGPQVKLQQGEQPPKELRGSSSSVRKERKIIKAEEKDVKMGSRLGDLLVPLLSLGVLVLIVAFIFIPFGTEVMETRDQSAALKKEIERNEEKIDVLGGINLSELEDKLDTVSVVVRDTMDVSEMAIEVEQLALANNLRPLSQSATNTEDVVSISSTVDYDWVPSYARAISGPFAYKGEFRDLTAFLNDLRYSTKTILSMGSVSISISTADEDDDSGNEYWKINLSISGYTAEPAQSANIADPVRIDIDENLFNEIEERVGETPADEDVEESEEETDETENGDEQ